MKPRIKFFLQSLILIVLFTSCNNENAADVIIKTPKSRDASIECDSIVSSTISLNSITWTYSTLNGRPYLLTNFFESDTIVSPTDFYHMLEIIDLNRDGYLDIRVYAVSNTPNQCDTYLFDSSDSTFRMLKGTMLDLVKLGDTEFYHYYLASGCADSDWESELGIIKDFEFYSIARIDGLACESRGADNRKIEISKKRFDKNEWELIETLDFDTNVNESQNKWSFIKAYWDENYKKFR